MSESSETIEWGGGSVHMGGNTADRWMGDVTDPAEEGARPASSVSGLKYTRGEGRERGSNRVAQWRRSGGNGSPGEVGPVPLPEF